MAKFKVGDKVVLEIAKIQEFGNVPVNYLTTCGVRVPIKDLDKADLMAEKAAEPKPAAKEATKKTAAKK